MLQYIASQLLKILGWKTQINTSLPEKVLVLGAPHTSNWDFPLALLTFKALGHKFSWIGKHTLFKGPAGPLMRKLGGIPVNRMVRTGFLDAMVEAFQTSDSLVLGIAPEGTRSKTNHWKAGFYHIAMKADVEICLGFADYPSKTVGLGPCFKPSGDIRKDFKIIEEFYNSKEGKKPQNQSLLLLRDKEVSLFNKVFRS